MSVSAESESVYVFTPSSGSVQLCTVLHSAQFCTVYTHSAQLPVNSFASAQLAFIFLPAFGGSRHVLTIIMRMMITMTLTYEYDVMMIEN